MPVANESPQYAALYSAISRHVAPMPMTPLRCLFRCLLIGAPPHGLFSSFILIRRAMPSPDFAIFDIFDTQPPSAAARCFMSAARFNAAIHAALAREILAVYSIADMSFRRRCRAGAVMRRFLMSALTRRYYGHRRATSFRPGRRLAFRRHATTITMFAADALMACRRRRLMPCRRRSAGMTTSRPMLSAEAAYFSLPRAAASSGRVVFPEAQSSERRRDTRDSLIFIPDSRADFDARSPAECKVHAARRFN